MMDEDQSKPTSEYIRDLAKRIADQAPRCEECGKDALAKYRDARWLCERHFQIAFHEEFGRWPGEE